MEFKHIPIMLKEVIENLNIKSNGVYVDATVGGAGHSSEIAKKLGKNGTLVCFDKDKTAIDVSRERLKNFECKVIFANCDFCEIKTFLQEQGISQVDGILADLGVSSYQIDETERGFSYMHNARLDMRMDTTQNFSAWEIVNKYSEKDLLRILYDYGEENYAKSIVRNIIQSRDIAPINTTGELVKIIEMSVPKKALHKGGSVAKKTFQALRIETNGELDSLKTGLEDMISLLRKNGRICIITFHSLEDRIVKNCFTEHATDCICPKELPVCVCGHKADLRLVSKKPIVPSEEEIKFNSRSSSSKLRVAEKV
jgi:16S rRNA (cytosine1402-N4)-methyltransferase